ncbi:unnamed protein product [Prorocentrum cordatum]|uniref:Uncharacterized protein n=1 Tax=Prorocentrum cordatum TaxID=2364126 RepID=A0ABN9SBS2_9DINO|nr:unnamed protein product [Polarella glacialis]
MSVRHFFPRPGCLGQQNPLRRSFLERFLDPGEVKACLEGAGAAAGGAPAAPLPDAGDWSDVPEAFWPLYEAVLKRRHGAPSDHPAEGP